MNKNKDAIRNDSNARASHNKIIPLLKFCRDCIYHAPEFGRHYCDRPIPNLVMGGVRKLHEDCCREREVDDKYVCGREGRYFYKKSDNETG